MDVQCYHMPVKLCSNSVLINDWMLGPFEYKYVES